MLFMFTQGLRLGEEDREVGEKVRPCMGGGSEFSKGAEDEGMSETARERRRWQLSPALWGSVNPATCYLPPWEGVY